MLTRTGTWFGTSILMHHGEEQMQDTKRNKIPTECKDLPKNSECVNSVYP